MHKGSARNAVFISACLGMLLFGITLITLGSVSQSVQERFSLDAASTGTLFSILPFGILAGSLVFGPFADKYGYKVIFLSASAAMFMGFEGISNATSLDVLKFSVFAFGFGGGCINGATNAVISDISADDKSANLSILGVFFAIGALGMPFILATLQDQFSIQSIVTIIGFLPMLFGVFFLLVRFPEAKHIKGTPLSNALVLLRDPWLLFIGFFLFCQSGFEAIINNWTTSFLMQMNHVRSTAALYALTLYVAAMAIMRVILGSALRKATPKTILLISIALLLTGSGLMRFSSTYYTSVGGLISIGAGLAAGFPVMLAFVGNRYGDVSGTAFSVVISIALVGNMLINYTMGIIVRNLGVGHLATLSGLLTVLMFISSIIILKQPKS